MAENDYDDLLNSGRIATDEEVEAMRVVQAQRGPGRPRTVDHEARASAKTARSKAREIERDRYIRAKLTAELEHGTKHPRPPYYELLQTKANLRAEHVANMALIP